MSEYKQLSRSVKGLTVLVTGAASGMGRATARVFADEGANVAVTDLTEDGTQAVAKEISASGGSAKAWTLDVSDRDAIIKVVNDVAAHFGGLDIIVNNAGISVRVPIDDPGYEDAWAKGIAVMLTAHPRIIRAALPYLRKSRSPRIVNIASIAGKEGNPNAAHYSSSKAGLIALTKSLGKELAQHDILVNAVTPAAAKTAIFDQMTQAHIDFMLSKIPKARFVQVEELAAMVAWLASEDCAFSTGAVFDISGGRATY